MARTIASLRTPALVCHGDVLERNARAMLERAARLGCELRPHVKTVKTAEAAALATGGTRRRVTVSTLAEAAFLADAGFDDILYAVPLTPDKLDDVLALAAQLTAFHVMVDHADHVAFLTTPAARYACGALSVWLCVDCGYGRDGVDPNDPASTELARRLAASPHTVFAGLYTHGGHSYGAASAAEIGSIGGAERDAAVGLAEALRGAGIEVPRVGVGSTPTCAVPPLHLDGVDEIHPGNYLYFDMTQVALGSCTVANPSPRSEPAPRPNPGLDIRWRSARARLPTWRCAC